MSSSVSVRPSYVLRVLGLSPEVPASSITTALKQAQPTAVHAIKTDRSALVKFRRNKEVS